MVRPSYSSRRPLYHVGASKAQAATRDYVLKLVQLEGQVPLLSVFGGKITTSRKPAEHALEKLTGYFQNAGGTRNREASLPVANVADYISEK